MAPVTVRQDSACVEQDLKVTRVISVPLATSTTPCASVSICAPQAWVGSMNGPVCSRYPEVISALLTTDALLEKRRPKMSTRQGWHRGSQCENSSLPLPAVG